MFVVIFIFAIAFIPMLWVRSANKLTKEMEKVKEFLRFSW